MRMALLFFARIGGRCSTGASASKATSLKLWLGEFMSQIDNRMQRKRSNQEAELHYLSRRR
ncbi:hypothetical protein GFM29_04570 [Rhizobium leguminosarum bv. viciae]|nr:hypothetical protein [Rhizobium leguminosarum bv. viciae]